MPAVVVDVTETPTVSFGGVNAASTYKPVDVTSRPVVFFSRSIITNVTVLPDSAAPGVQIGTAQANLTFLPVGSYPPATRFGTPQANASSTAAGIESTLSVGEPHLNKVMRYVGIGSAAAVGEPASATTCKPGSAVSVNGFGDPLVTKRGWIFRPPTIVLGWRFQKRYEGVSLLKEAGVWSEVSHPDLERTRAAQNYLAGGRDHVVSDGLKAELVGAGYSVTEEIVTTEEYRS